MFERTIDIIALFLLAISNNINLFLSSLENVRKMKLFNTLSRLKKINIDKSNLDVTCTQN